MDQQTRIATRREWRLGAPRVQQAAVAGGCDDRDGGGSAEVVGRGPALPHRNREGTGACRGSRLAATAVSSSRPCCADGRAA